MPPLDVFLDTNVFCADYRMESNPFRLLLNEAGEGRVRIVVPEVVLDEVGRKFRDAIGAALHTYRDAIGVLARLRVIRGEAHLLSEVQAYRTYISDLRSRLADADALFLPYPNVTHKHVTQRILARRRPSSGKDDAYRDILMWETLLQFASANSGMVALVTNDSRGFADDTKKQLHGHLKDDLRERGVEERVLLYPTLREFALDNVAPAQAELVALKRLTYEDADFAARLVDDLHSLLRYNIQPALHWTDSQYQDELLVRFEAHRLDFRDARELEDGVILVEIALTGEAGIAAEINAGELDAVSTRDDALVVDVDDWLLHDPSRVVVEFSRRAVAEIEATWHSRDRRVSDARLVRVRASARAVAGPQEEVLF